MMVMEQPEPLPAMIPPGIIPLTLMQESPMESSESRSQIPEAIGTV